MTGRIYLLSDNQDMVAMEETAYDSESLLQQLLAEYPDLLAGEQIHSEDPRRWLLVTREMGVPGDDDGASRWSLDHLFLDQEAVPTLVEVKKGSNNEIRRKVVGQMLDYAANAVAYWPVEEIRAKFERRCEQNDDDPEDVLNAFLDEAQEVDEFWQRVKTNLQAGRVRLVFVADVIPAELRRVVQFLNEQMDPAEVLAVEVKQYIGKGMKTLVPRLTGQSETARQKKAGGSKKGNKWDLESLLAAIEENGGVASRETAAEMIEWLKPRVTDLWWGFGKNEGGCVPRIITKRAKYQICRISTAGFFVFCFDWLRKRQPFNDESVRRTLLDKINGIDGAHFDDQVLTKRARIPLEALNNPAATEKLKGVMEWLIGQIHGSE